ncbi:MAG: RNA polymerase sigma factor, partial [Chloroflexota bacterium]
MLAEGLDELAVRAKEGDKAALAALYDHLRPAMARTVGRCRGATGWGLLEGEDLLQEGYLILSDLVRRWPGQGQFGAWFNCLFPLGIVDYRRGRLQWDGPAVESLPQAELVDLVESQAAGSVTEDPTDPLLCRELLALLPEGHRQVLCWRYFDGLTFREIERVHGLAAASAQRRCAQALTFLRARA